MKEQIKREFELVIEKGLENVISAMTETNFSTIEELEQKLNEG
jgi:tRNA threonylcarbamoyladenosine modification (KEOPS) complex Cgi121 subunit